MEVGVMKKQKYIYEGTKQPDIKGKLGPNGREYFPYLPDPQLVKAVNLAIALKRPLLLEGEPGCGKTRLADAIAYEFTQKYRDHIKEGDWWFYETWNVRSTGQAEDGLYRFDGVRRLRDAQLVGLSGAKLKLVEQYLGEDKELKDQDFLSHERYVEMGALGKALEQTSVTLPLVLIDEIDKADSDFANDLLDVLDRKQFTVAETGETYPDPKRSDDKPEPLIIITSNRERPLPEPFLRRCLYFYLDFPEAQLKQILQKRFGESEIEGRQELVDETIAHFLDVRELMAAQPGSKLPGTSELLDFLTAIEEDSVKEGLEALKQLAQRSELLGLVLKTKEAQRLYREEYGA
jgi:MoxR-like ATPase